MEPTHAEVTALLDELRRAGVVRRLDLLHEALRRAHRAGHRDGLAEAARQQTDR